MPKAESAIERLGSLAVKRVLGKDESPGSNPGLGSSPSSRARRRFHAVGPSPAANPIPLARNLQTMTFADLFDAAAGYETDSDSIRAALAERRSTPPSGDGED